MMFLKLMRMWHYRAENPIAFVINCALRLCLACVNTNFLATRAVAKNF